MANIYLLNELSEKLNIPHHQLTEWEKDKLFKPAGYTEDGVPYFTEEIFKECTVIQNFINLGYSVNEIQKIIKNVGLPKEIVNGKNTRLKKKLLTVGELAERANISARTIKHWEDKGIIEPDMRSEGGFRLYGENYVFFCSLILDLQNFNYSLDEIKIISDYFRNFLYFQKSPEQFTKEEINIETQKMEKEIANLFDKMGKLKEGIERWEKLLKSKHKEIEMIKQKNEERVN
ncbi:MAG TPA: MerR family transcriptional regulator [Melioribacteraceae bacterium]|nr:MerR family transcriptional regulator [Melioribacteraceae bacterium]